MKILMMTECLASGVLQVIKDVCDQMKEEHEIYLVYSRREETPEIHKLNELFEGVNLILVQSQRSISLIKDLKALSEYRLLIQKINPDIIHVHSSKAGVYGRIANFLARSSKRRIFYSPHGFSFLRQDQNKFINKIYYLIEKFMAVFPGDIVAVSETEKNIACNIMSHKRVHLINNGINCRDIELQLNLNKAERKNLFSGSIRGKKIIGTVGRLSYQKNPFFALEFMKKIKDDGIGEFIFVWIGGGELEAELLSKIAEYNLQEQFIITGWMERVEALSLIKLIDYYVLFSLWEGLPVSLLEAMFLNKAPIATNIVGNKDVIDNEKNGVLINSVNEAVTALYYYYNNPEIYTRQSNTARNDVLNHFNISHTVEKYKGLYLTKQRMEKY